MKNYITFLFLLTAFYSKSQNYIHFFNNPSPPTESVASRDVMTQRIKSDAVEYAKYAPVQRIAKMDFSFGMDLNEYKKLGGYGVLYISSLNQDSTEYPIKRVYFKNNEKIIELKKIGEIKIPVTDSQIIHTFGSNRTDYYYLIPHYLTMQTNELLIDWSKNRKEFVLSKYPNSEKLDFIKDDNKFAGQGTVDQKVLREFLLREYNIFTD
jgi:hypothetical protein